MLPKSKRLTREEFSTVFSRGTHKHNPLFHVITHGAPSFKAAVVVPKKVHTRAVRRNKLKRAIYSMVAREYALFAAPANHYIIIVKPAITHASRRDIEASVRVIVGRRQYSR